MHTSRWTAEKLGQHIGGMCQSVSRDVRKCMGLTSAACKALVLFQVALRTIAETAVAIACSSSFTSLQNPE